MSGAHSVGPFGLTWLGLAESLLASVDPGSVGSAKCRAFAEWLAMLEAHPEYSLQPGETEFAVIAVETGYLSWMHGPPERADARDLPVRARVRQTLCDAAREAGISVMRPRAR